MKLLLKSFSQDVDLASPEDIHYFLIFDAEGQEVKLPVQKDTTEALINLIYSVGDADGDTDDRDVGDNLGDLAFEAPTRNSNVNNHRSPGNESIEQEDANLDGAEVFGNNGSSSQDESPETEEEVDSL